MIRFGAFVTLMILVTFVPWYAVVPLIVGYGWYWHDAYELIILGLLIDSYFGVYSTVPYYTLAIGCALLLLEWVRAQVFIHAAH